MSMRISSCLWLLVLCVVTTASVSAVGAGGAVGEQSPIQSQGVLFTQPLLSETEQADYRARIRSTNDEAERERIRSAHYELMKARAKERGYALPESRPATTGIKGEAFSPQLITEEERAAQRAKIRARSEPPGGMPAGRESAVDIAKPAPQKKTGDNSKQDVTGKPVVDAKTAALPTATAAPPAKALTQTPAASASITLPGIDTIFGPQLMTEEEKSDYRARLRRAKSDEERQAIRAERDRQLLLRAQEKGVSGPR